jgi:hypothetical protein
MAKKTTKSAAKPSKAPAKKAPAKATKKKAPAKKQAKPVEIELDPAEAKAIELAHASDEVCTELEDAVTSAISQAVRKVFKQHDVALTSDQAEEVALLLFGD